MSAPERSGSPFRVFVQPKMVVLLFLGFSSGLPLYLTSRTLQAWMTTEGVTLTAIGLFSLVGLPYSLKFLWSPLLDRYVPPRLGRRRGWLVLTQVALLVAIGAMALQDPGRALELLALNAVLIAFFSATQDIAFNAYQVDVLEEREMGAGAAVGVLGYRIALLVTGSAAFILADRLTWPTVYLLISVLMLVGVVAAVLAPEPALRGQPPETLGDAVRLPLRDFFVRIGRSQAIAVLAFVILYKLGDALAASMITPFLIQTGFRQAQIGTVQGGLGLLATIVGVVAGGGMLSRLGIPRSLWIFGGVQAGSNLAYLVLAQLGPSYGILVAAVLVENFSAGLGTAALVAYLMSLCSPRFSATQFALLSSLTAVSRDLLASPAGAIAQVTGWPLFFLLTLVAGIPGLLLLPIVAPWHRRSVRQMDSGPPAALPAEAT